MGKPEVDEVEVGVDAWVIQDGNYADFNVNDEVKCALEFHGELNATAQCTPSVTHLRQNIYRVRAQVVFVGPDAWAIDFGLPAYQEYRPPQSARIGAWVEGEINLGLDPFMYKDRLANECGMPNLLSTWIIAEIARDDTPWIESPCGKICPEIRTICIGPKYSELMLGTTITEEVLTFFVFRRHEDRGLHRSPGHNCKG